LFETLDSIKSTIFRFKGSTILQLCPIRDAESQKSVRNRPQDLIILIYCAKSLKNCAKIIEKKDEKKPKKRQETNII